MEILAKIYSSNWLTYQKFYKKAIILAFAKDGIDVSQCEFHYELIHIEGNTIQKQRHGSTPHSRTIRVYADGQIAYVIGVTNTNFDEDKRSEAESKGAKYVYGVNNYHSNTYLNQGINKILDTYLEEKKQNNRVKLFFYLLDTKQSYCSNLSNIFTYRKLATIGFDVLNIDEVDFSEWRKLGFLYTKGCNIAYQSFNKYLNDTAYISVQNGGNLPAYIKCVEDYDISDDDSDEIVPKVNKYIYTFKGLGAEAYDCFMNMWTLFILAQREQKHLEFLFAPEKYSFRLGQPTPKFTQDVPESIKHLFEAFDIPVEYETTDEIRQQFEREQSQYEKAKASGNPRNQELFRNNIRAKGIQTKCYLCGCEIDTILQAAHLWGVAEIKRASMKTINHALASDDLRDLLCDEEIATEPFYKRYVLANSGDNGVWMCNNHHGLFDGHYFCFNSENGDVIFDITKDEESKAYFEKITTETHLANEVLTERTKAFLRLSARQMVLL